MGILTYITNHIVDFIIYGLIGASFLLGVFKCCRPVLRGGGALRRGSHLLKEGAKAKLGRPVWSDPNFLGKPLAPVWRAYLQSADMGAGSGVSSDVAEYIHDDSIITEPGRASLAQLIPGICTSLGILGTFIGLAMGLSNLDVMEINSYVQLTRGIAFAFNTSIVGIIASLTFNFLYSLSTGRAREAIDSFHAAFYMYGIAQPPDAATQLLTYEREQADALTQFAKDLSVRIAGDIQRAISASMTPVQQAMEDFIHFATRAQVDGLDYVVTRFVDRMNAALDTEITRLKEAFSTAAEGQARAQEQLRASVVSIEEITRGATRMHGMTEEVMSRFGAYANDMGTAYRKVTETQAEALDLLEAMSESADRQAKYLSSLQEYQTRLQQSFQEYTVFTDRFVGGVEAQNDGQRQAVETMAKEMRESAALLRSAYGDFADALAASLANAQGVLNAKAQEAAIAGDAQTAALNAGAEDATKDSREVT